MQIPIEISARHIHLCQKDLDTLFGAGYKLSKLKPLSQPNQFAASEFLTIENNGKIIERVRILGPVRNETQVEISKTDAVKLGIDAPIRVSGDLTETPGIKLVSLSESVIISNGVIIAKRHLHISPQEAKEISLNDGDEISVKVEGDRSLVFNSIIVRSRENVDEFSLHLDTDEANAANVIAGTMGEIV